MLFRPARPATHPVARYPGFHPHARVMARGTRVKPGARALNCAIEMQQDVAVRLRDDTQIYVDVLRPAGAGPTPVILSWSPYGKQGGIMRLEDIPQRAGIPESWLSGLEMFEGPDPAYWCAHGYTVINVDARGAFNSQGDIHFWGTQDAQDGYDVIEWAAAQPWSNGRIGMSGNSWLAIAQWFIAAQRPPHLAAIAPWEGWTDLYRCDVIRGGIPDIGFNEYMINLFAGAGRVEDVPGMVRAHPLMNDYWRDKMPQLEQIYAPAYIVGSWTNLIHASGTLRGYRLIGSSDKWLRIHNTHEWRDYYQNVEDLRLFFDHYLKQIDNHWPQTPRVRYAVLDPGWRDTVDRPAVDFPLPQTAYQSLYLDASSGQLTQPPPTTEANVSYGATDPQGTVTFRYRVEHDIELVGYFALRLWVSAIDADDLDVYVEVRKYLRNGQHALAHNIRAPNPFKAWWLERQYRAGKAKMGMMFFTGAKGMLRASHRELDRARSGPAEPYHAHERPLKLASGEIVPVEIPLWPLGMRWHAGEELRLLIAGHKLSAVEMPGVSPPDTINRGRHVIHTGGRYDSRLIVPQASVIDRR
jgi:predicted acyl esterase